MMFPPKSEVIKDKKPDTAEAGKSSASDQPITYRKIGEVIPVVVAGRTFHIKGSTYFLHSLIVDKVRTSAEFSAEIYDRIKAKEDEPESEGVSEAVAALLKDYLSMMNQTDDYIWKCVQLILYDAHDRKWQLDANDWPQESEMDTVITTKEISRIASIEEVNNVIAVYSQLNNPVVPRKSFFGIKGTM